MRKRHLRYRRSGFDQAFLEHFFVAEPEVWDVGGAEAKDVFKRAADFAEPEVDTDAIEKIEQWLSALGKQRLGCGAGAIEPMIGKDVNGVWSVTVTNDVQKSAGDGERSLLSKCLTGCGGAHCVSRKLGPGDLNCTR